MQVNGLGYTIGAGADYPGHLGAMAVFIIRIGIIIHKVIPAGNTPAEFNVAGANAGIEHVNVHARSGGSGVVVQVIPRENSLIDAIQSPKTWDNSSIFSI